MKILPAFTQLPSQPIRRRHTPAKASGVAGYLRCLRWEFGFSCAFCLLHEADFSVSGVKGSGLFEIEHFRPRHFSSQSSYQNLFYVCRYCNRARGTIPVLDPSGRARLLDPTQSAWADHFRLENDELQPLPGDFDAAYTAEAYDLNEPLKVVLRRKRQQSIKECVDFLLAENHLEKRLLEAAVERQDLALLEACEILHQHGRRAVQYLLQHAPIPADADTACLCGTTTNHVLPEWLAAQTLDLSTQVHTS